MASTPGFEPGPHWWEASALTTAPPLLPNNKFVFENRSLKVEFILKIGVENQNLFSKIGV